MEQKLALCQNRGAACVYAYWLGSSQSSPHFPNDRVYPQKADFTFYGGLYRGVNLILVPETHFEPVKDGTPGIKVTPIVSDDLQSAAVTVETWQNGGTVTYTLMGLLSARISKVTHAGFVTCACRIWNLQ